MKNQPQLILVTGFLGSGKTTLLLQIADYLTKNNKKCAIIENEIGEIGIDNLYAKKLGYDVYDLFGGCVCCTLKISLQSTIIDLTVWEDSLDYILFEPSGIADPEQLYETLLTCGYGTNENTANIFVLDPFRIQLYKEQLNMLYEHFVNCATMIIVNKIDIAEAEKLYDIDDLLRISRCEIPVFKLNILEDLPKALKQNLLHERS